MLAVVLGASEWPDYSNSIQYSSFRRSALEFADYLRDRDGLKLLQRNVKVFFDSFDDAPDIVWQMHSFILTA